MSGTRDYERVITQGIAELRSANPDLKAIPLPIAERLNEIRRQSAEIGRRAAAAAPRGAIPTGPTAMPTASSQQAQGGEAAPAPAAPVTLPPRQSTALERLRAKGKIPAAGAAKPGETPNYEAESVGQVVGDFGQALQAGAREGFAKPMFEAVAWVGDQFGADLQTVKGIADMLSVHADEDRAQMSAQGRGALKNGSLKDPFALSMKVVNNIPSLLSSLIPTLGAANWAARGKKGIEAATAAAKAAGITGSVTEGTQILGSTAGSIREFFGQAPDTDIRKAAQAAELDSWETRSADDLRAELQNSVAARLAPVVAGAVGAATGYVGGKAVGKLIGEGGGRVVGTMRGAGIEAGQEAPQSGAEEAITQQATTQTVDGGKVLDATIEGGVIGGILGGAATGMTIRDKTDLETQGAATDADAAALAAARAAQTPAQAAAVGQSEQDVLRKAQDAQAMQATASQATQAHTAARVALAAELQKGAGADPAKAEQLKAAVVAAAQQEQMAQDALKLSMGQTVGQDAPPPPAPGAPGAPAGGPPPTPGAPMRRGESTVGRKPDGLPPGAYTTDDPRSQPPAAPAAPAAVAPPAEAVAPGAVAPTSTPEPRADLAAQVADAQNPATPARAVYLSPEQVVDDLQYTRQQFHGGPLHEVKDANGGVLLTDDEQIAQQYEQAGATDEARAVALNYAQPKSEANVPGAVVVERTDPETGAVAQGQVVDSTAAEAVAGEQEATAAAAGTGETVVVRPPEAAQESRAARRGAEALPLNQLRTMSDQLRTALTPGARRTTASRSGLMTAINHAVAMLHGATAKTSESGVFTALERRGLLTEEQTKQLSAFAKHRQVGAGAGGAKGEGGKTRGTLNREKLTALATDLLAAVDNVLGTVSDDQYAAAAPAPAPTPAAKAKAVSARRSAAPAAPAPAVAPVAVAPVASVPAQEATKEEDTTDYRTIGFVDDKGKYTKRHAWQEVGKLPNGTTVYERDGGRVYVAEDGTVSEDRKSGVTIIGTKGETSPSPKKEVGAIKRKRNVRAAERAEKAAEVGNAGLARRETVGDPEKGELVVTNEPITQARATLLEFLGLPRGTSTEEREAALDEILKGVTSFGLAADLASRFAPVPDTDSMYVEGEVGSLASIANKQQREKIKERRTPEQAAAYEEILALSNSWPSDPKSTEAAFLRGMLKAKMNAFPGGAWPEAAQKEWITLRERAASTSQEKRVEDRRLEEEHAAVRKAALAERAKANKRSVREQLIAERKAARSEEEVREVMGDAETIDPTNLEGLTPVEEAVVGAEAWAQQEDANEVEDAARAAAIKAAEQKLRDDMKRTGKKMSDAELREYAVFLAEQEQDLAGETDSMRSMDEESGMDWGGQDAGTDFDTNNWEGRDGSANLSPPPPGAAARSRLTGYAAMLHALGASRARKGEAVTVQDAMDLLLSSDALANKPFLRMLAQKLRNMKIKTPVHLVYERRNGYGGWFTGPAFDAELSDGTPVTAFLGEDTQGMDPFAGTSFNKPSIFLTPVPDTASRHGDIGINLAIDDNDKLIRTLLHEIIHAVTVRRLFTDAKFANDVNQLFDYAKSKMGPSWSQHYGMMNAKEFLAEAFTNTRFQEELGKIALPVQWRTTMRARTVWDAFVGVVKRSLGMSAVPNSVLDEVLRMGSEFTPHSEAKQWQETPEFDRLRDVYKGQGEQWKRERDAADRMRAIAFNDYDDGAVSGAPQNQGQQPPAAPPATAPGASPGMAQSAARGHPAALKWMMFDHLERYGKRILRTVPGGRAFHDYMAALRRKMHEARAMQQEGEHLVRALLKYADKNPQEAEAFSQLRHDATSFEVDPTVPFNHANNLHLHTQPAAGLHVYNAVKAKYDALSATGQQLFQDEKAFHETQMDRRRYAALNIFVRNRNIPHPALVLSAFLGTNSAVPHLTTKQARLAFMRSVMLQPGATPAQQAAATKKAGDVMDKIEKIIADTSVRGSYFPLHREGDMVVDGERTGTLPLTMPVGITKDVADDMAAAAVQADAIMHPGRTHDIHRDAAGWPTGVTYTDRVTSMHTTQREAEDMAAKLRTQGFVIGHIGVKTVSTQTSTEGLAALISTLQSKSNPTPGVADAVREAFIQLLVENSIRKSDLQRSRIIGADQSFADGVKTLANRAYAGSWAIADLTTVLDEQDALGKLLVLQKDNSLPNVARIGDLVNELQERKAMEGVDRAQNGLRTAESLATRTAFVFYLGSLSYAMTNATQLVFVGLPFLAARHGPKAAAVMLKYMGKFAKVAAVRLAKGVFDVGRLRTHHLDDFFDDVLASTRVNGANTRMTEMLHELSLRNVVDSSMIFELGRVASGRGQSKSRVVRGVGRAADYIESAAKLLPQLTEIMNRVVLAATAFELENGSAPGNLAKATDYAHEAISKTQGDYSDFNKSRILKQHIPMHRALLLYKTYGVLMYTFMGEHMAASVRKVDTTASAQEQALQKQEKRESARALGYFFGINAAAVGAVGVMIEPLKVASLLVGAGIKAAQKMDDDDDDEDIAQLSESLLSPETGLRRYMHSVTDDATAALLSDGLMNATGADWQGRIAPNHLLWMPQPPADSNVGWMQNTMVGLLGPVASLLMRPAKAMDAIERGDTQRAAEVLLPKGAGDLLKASRTMEGGRGVQDSRGVPFIRPEDYSVGETLWQAIGIAPTKQSRTYEQKNIQQGTAAGLMDRRDNLRLRWLNGDEATRARVWDREIRPFNAEHRDPKLRISYASLLKSRQEQRKKANEYGRGQFTDLREAREGSW